MTQHKEPTILPVRPGTLSDADKAALQSAGILVIEHPRPDELRLIKPCLSIGGNEMLMDALEMLSGQHSTQTLQSAMFKRIQQRISDLVKNVAP